MQDRYVADVGDFGKYGLLRCLTGVTSNPKKPKLKLGVIWYLTPSCLGNANDGKHLNYLDREKEFKVCDPVLFQRLKKLRGEITLENDHSVRRPEFLRTEENFIVTKPALECIQNLKLFGGASFYDKPLCANTDRVEWWKGARGQLEEECKLIFMDPDNGLRVSYKGDDACFISYSEETPGQKHIYIEEIKEVIEDWKASVVFYHHLGRHGGKHNQQIDKVARQLVKELPKDVSIRCIRYRRGSGRAFFILAHKDHNDILRQRINLFTRSSSEWVKREHLKLAYPKTI